MRDAALLKNSSDAERSDLGSGTPPPGPFIKPSLPSQRQICIITNEQAISPPFYGRKGWRDMGIGRRRTKRIWLRAFGFAEIQPNTGLQICLKRYTIFCFETLER